MTLIVNLYGAPCAGKSTTRADVFCKLKTAGVNCEEVYETAKKLTWANREKELTCQPYIFAKQLRDIEMLNGQVDVIVTDSPLLLSRFYTMKYCPTKYPASFLALVHEQSNMFNSLNYWIDRVGTYNSSGRNQNEQQSDEIRDELLGMLDSLEISYKRVPGQEGTAAVIVDDVLFRLGHREGR